MFNFTKKIFIFFLVFFSLFVFKSPVFASVLSFWDDSSISDAVADYYYVYPLGSGLTDTITSIHTKVKLKTAGQVYNVSVSFRGDRLDSKGYCQSDSRFFGFSSIDDSNFVVTPSACRVSSYTGVKLMVSESCPVGTVVDIYVDDFSFTFNPDYFYTLGVSSGSTVAHMDIYGSSGVGTYAHGGSCTSCYMIHSPVPTLPDSNCLESGLKTPYVVLNGYYGPPTGEFTDEQVDSVNNELIVSGEFDFKYKGEGYVAIADFFRQCETTSGEFEIQGHGVAQIKWYADDDVDVTIDNGGGYYTGAGYTADDSTGTYSNVRLPFTPGMNCTYPVFFRILDGDGNVVYNSISGDSINPLELIPEGSTSLIETPEVEEEYTGIFSGIINWIKKYIFGFFSLAPLKSELSYYINYFKNTLSVKAPFGYVMTALGSDLTSPIVVDMTPNMAVDLSNSSYDLPSVTVDFPSEFDSVMNTVRTIFEVILWVLFFMYILSLTRRFFQ